MNAARQQKYQRKAGPLLEPGERVEAAVDGFSSVAARLLGLISYPNFAKIVLVTDKSVYLCKGTAILGPDSVIARYPRNSVKLDLRGSHLHIGDQHTLLVMAGRKSSAREVVEAAGAPTKL